MNYFGIFSTWVLITTLAFAGTPCDQEKSNCSQLWNIQNGSQVEIFLSHPFQKIDSDIERAVITIHGVNRNASEYYTWTLRAAKLAAAEKKTLIIAPHFKGEDDPKLPTELYWSGSGWKSGGLSLNKNPSQQLSSFIFMDRLVGSLFKNRAFPQLKEVVIVGHSAGGQFMSRYSVTGRLSTLLPIRYIISNPSSYMYLNPSRPTENPTDFKVPALEDCPEYDDYGYGMNKRNAYSSSTPISELQARFASRNVTLLLGEQDVESENLDTGCEANLQGKNRYERGNFYFEYIRSEFPIAHITKTTVPGVGHDSEKMYASKVGQETLFQ